MWKCFPKKGQSYESTLLNFQKEKYKPDIIWQINKNTGWFTPKEDKSFCMVVCQPSDGGLLWGAPFIQTNYFCSIPSNLSVLAKSKWKLNVIISLMLKLKSEKKWACLAGETAAGILMHPSSQVELLFIFFYFVAVLFWKLWLLPASVSVEMKLICFREQNNPTKKMKEKE